MLAARAERAPLLQRGKITKGANAPKADTLAASAMRQARRGLGVFGVALALSGVVVAMMAAPDAGTKKRAASRPGRIVAEELLCEELSGAPDTLVD